MITKFDEFIKEKFDYKEHKPLEGVCGVKIGKKEIEMKISDLVEFAKKYDIEDIDLDKLHHKGLWKDDTWKKGGVLKPAGSDKWLKWKDLSDEQKKDMEEEVKTTIDRANLKYPIIIAKSKRGKMTIVDGNHRVEKAYKLGKDTIKARVIPDEDLLKKFGI